MPSSVYNYGKGKFMSEEKITIKVCMGSSCFARGNASNLEYIENFVKDNKLDASIEVIGSRCENKCATGPNVIINGECVSNASTINLEKVLSKYLPVTK